MLVALEAKLETDPSTVLDEIAEAAGLSLPDVVDDFDMPGYFVVGDLSAAEINDLARFDPLALYRHNKRETKCHRHGRCGASSQVLVC